MVRAIKTLLFDLDDTLYPKSSGLMPEVSRRIGLYLQQRLGFDSEQADELRLRYRGAYGSSLVGLVYIDKIDPNEYINFVYDIDYPKFITPNPRLVELLELFPQDKIIYTNGSRIHVEAVVRLLGIEGMYKRIVAIEDVAYYAKPMPQSFEGMLKLTGIKPEETIFFDDQEQNLIAASKFGLYTAMVGGNSGTATFSMEEVTHFSADHIRCL